MSRPKKSTRRRNVHNVYSSIHVLDKHSRKLISRCFEMVKLPKQLVQLSNIADILLRIVRVLYRRNAYSFFCCIKRFLHLVFWPNHFSYIVTVLEVVVVILMLIKSTYMYGS